MSPKSNKNLIGTILMHYFISHYDKTTNNIYLVYKVFLNLPVVLEMFQLLIFPFQTRRFRLSTEYPLKGPRSVVSLNSRESPGRSVARIYRQRTMQACGKKIEFRFDSKRILHFSFGNYHLYHSPHYTSQYKDLFLTCILYTIETTRNIRIVCNAKYGHLYGHLLNTVSSFEILFTIWKRLHIQLVCHC